jgi:hypothetical protein
MTKPLFCTWFEKFIGFSAQKESPVLLLLDGHMSHIKSLQLMNNASENRVITLYFTPHCTHRLSIGLHLIQHQIRSLAPAKIQKEMRYLVVGLQIFPFQSPTEIIPIPNIRQDKKSVMKKV